MATGLTREEVVKVYNGIRQELQNIAQKVNELEAEKSEHKLVIDNMKTLDPQRKCFRLIGGVLVERTVEQVLPALEKNHDNINTLINQLSDTFKQKEKELADLTKKYNIQVRGETPRSQ